MGLNEETVARYRIDAGRSRFIVQGFADGLLSVFGHNPLIAVCGFGGTRIVDMLVGEQLPRIC